MYKTISCLLAITLGTWIGDSALVAKLAYPKIVAQIALTNQAASIPATTVLTPTKSALYRISAYMVEPSRNTASCGNACGQVVANFQWTDDGGKQVMSNPPGPGVSITSPIAIPLYAGCPYTNDPGTCIPALATGSLPGATFLVRANAGTPLIYSTTAEVQSGVAYDFFMTVEQLQ